MKEENRKILSYGIELLIILVSILMASFAWLNNNKEIKANDLYVKTNSYLDLLVSLDGVNFSTETTVNIDEKFKFKNEITGNGIDFYIPSIKREDGTPISFKSATPKDYLEFDIWFKLSGTGSVFLDDGSYVLPLAGTTKDELIGNTVERISSSGNFSRDLIASSVRMAFIDNDYIDNKYITKNEPNLVWAPNKQYEITCDKYCNVNLNSNNKQNYTYIDASDSTNYKEKNVKNLIDTLHTTFGSNNSGGDPSITTITTDDDIKKVTVRIWIEGNDRDNVTALTGGIFKMNLNFTALSKQTNSNIPNVTINNDTINGFDETMEYSTDYGISWGSELKSFDKETVYVRYKETAGVFASDYKILNF